MPHKKVAWIEGREEAQNIINKLANEIVNAVLPDSVPNKWRKEFESDDYLWVTYEENFRGNVQGYYKHTDGKFYPVYKIKDNTSYIVGGVELVDVDGYIWEVSGSSNIKTGKKFQVKSFTYINELGEQIILQVPDLLVVNVEDSTKESGRRCYVVEQVRQELDGSFKEDKQWNEFRIVTEMPSDWDYLLKLKENNKKVLIKYYDGYPYYLDGVTNYTFTERYYTAEVNSFDKTVVISCIPDAPASVTEKKFYVMFKHPQNQYNYFDVYYGDGFEAIQAQGDPKLTYEGVCDLTTVKLGSTPVIIDQKKAEDIYKKMNDNTILLFVPPSISWKKDYDGTEIVSPPAHYFYGADANVTWLTKNKRRPDYFVNYWISVNNDFVALVIEGDPAPDMDGYYRSFGYFGKIEPFNETDYVNNFAVTVGMGDLVTAKTGFTINDIKQDTNPIYSGYGKYTSNGMYSVSMLKTNGNVLFQAHYPAFLTQLPNYKGVGTLPSDLTRLVVEKNGFQKSAWTDKYHASPIYLVHQTEGYRGYMYGVIAINNHNLVNLDELIVDTEELKDPNDPSQGTWKEVYKFFVINTPVNFLKYSANPDEMTIAILKEVK